MSEDLLTVREVARLCGRTEETVRRWIWSGKLRARKLGNQMFISKNDLAAMQAPRAGETKATYGKGVREQFPLQNVRYTREEMLAALDRAVALGKRTREEYGGFDVGDLAYQSHEDEDG